MKTCRLLYWVWIISFWPGLKVNGQSVPVSINVDAATVGYRINDDFVGFSFEQKTLTTDGGGGTTLGSFWVATPTALTRLRNLLINISPSSVIRIGGNTGDQLAWKSGSRGSNTSTAQHFNSDIDKLFGFLSTVNWKCIYTVNFAKDSATYAGNAVAEAVAEASYIHATYGGLLKSISIGNEPMAYVVNKYRNPYNPSLYVANYLPVFDGIKAANSAIPISGGDIGRRTEYNTWNGTYLQRMNNISTTSPPRPINTFNVHAYPFRADELTGTPEQSIDALMNSLSVGSTFQTNLSYLANLAIANNTPLRMSETNTISGGQVTNVSNTFATGIWMLDYLYSLAMYKAEGVNFHSGGNSTSYAPLYRTTTTNGTYAIGANYYGLLAFVDGARNGRLLAVTPPNSSTNPRASYYATTSDDGRTVKITLINKDFTNTVNASVNVPGININTASYQTLRSQTNMFDVAANTFYANAQIAADGNFTKGVPTSLAVSTMSRVNVAVAPMSAVVVTLTASNPPLYTIKTGNWTDPTIWSENRLPTVTDVVVLKHAVTIPTGSVAHAQRIVHNANSPLLYNSRTQLRLGGL
ncbi:hypothetical protein GCM10027592_59360 [Spirosoma flavus]